MAFVVESKEFSGPLELLLHLIGSARIDIKDIFVSQVTEQYIRLVQDAGMLDMDEASEFIQMAATLLLIKSRSILPPSPMEEAEEEDPGTVLIRQLEEYARFQQLTAQMQGFEQAASRVFAKLPDEYPLPPVVYELEGLTLEGLLEAFARVSARMRLQDEPARQGGVIRLDQHSVSRCMAQILRQTRRGSLRFSALFSQAPTRNEVVTLFLALLELLKQGRLRASQEQAEGEIVISRGRGKEGQDGQ